MKMLATGEINQVDNYLFIVFIRSSPDIRWKCYKNTVDNRKKNNWNVVCNLFFCNVYGIPIMMSYVEFLIEFFVAFQRGSLPAFI